MDEEQKMTVNMQGNLKVACIRAANAEGKFVADWVRETIEARLLAEGVECNWPKYQAARRGRKSGGD